MSRTKANIIRIVVIGLLLFQAFNLVLFILSIIFRFETEINRVAGLILGIVMAFIINAVIKVMKLKTRREAFIHSISWTLLTFLLLLLITIPNGTTRVLFGNWIAYVIFILMAFAPLINKRSN